MLQSTLQINNTRNGKSTMRLTKENIAPTVNEQLQEAQKCRCILLEGCLSKKKRLNYRIKEMEANIEKLEKKTKKAMAKEKKMKDYLVVQKCIKKAL